MVVVDLATQIVHVGRADQRAAVEGIAEFRPPFERDFWRARLLVDRGKLDEALAAFRALDAAKPADPDVVGRVERGQPVLFWS